MLIEFRNVNKYYGNFQVLKDINVQVKKGEVVVVVGMGSGKARCFGV